MDGTETCGRLEVYAFDGWQSVCSNEFEDWDATVACMHMGFGYVCVRVTTTMTTRTVRTIIGAKSDK